MCGPHPFPLHRRVGHRPLAARPSGTFSRTRRLYTLLSLRLVQRAASGTGRFRTSSSSDSGVRWLPATGDNP
jgi:hypothetical protein